MKKILLGFISFLLVLLSFNISFGENIGSIKKEENIKNNIVFKLEKMLPILYTQLIISKKELKKSFKGRKNIITIDLIVKKLSKQKLKKLFGKLEKIDISLIKFRKYKNMLNYLEAKVGIELYNKNIKIKKKYKSISLKEVNKIENYGTYILGNLDAKITFLQYCDLEGPFCKKMYDKDIINKILKLYNGKVNFIFKQFPLAFHTNAKKEAETILCAGEIQSDKKYYEFINTIYKRTYSNGKGFALDALVPLAKELGLSESKFKTCLDSGKFKNKVNSDIAEGQTIFNIIGTPGNVFINNKTGEWELLSGAYPIENFKKVINGLLKY